MDTVNKIRLICKEMAYSLTDKQLSELENVLYKMLYPYDESSVPAKLGFVSDVEVLKMFLATKKLAGRADSTLQAYNLELMTARKYINKCFTEWDVMDIRRYLAIMQTEGMCASTLNNKRRYLNSFFGFLVDENVVAHNPIDRIDAFNEPKRHKTAFSASDIEAMREVCTNPRDRAIIEFFLTTGLRVSEVTSLRVADLDMRNRSLRVIGKGNKQREVFFNESTEFYLVKYFEWRCEHEGVTMRELYNRPLFAFLRAPFSGLNNNGVRALMHKIGDMAGVENAHPHRFRRTFATIAIHRHMPIDKVRGMMGHVKMDTTLLYVDDSNYLGQTYINYMA